VHSSSDETEPLEVGYSSSESFGWVTPSHLDLFPSEGNAAQSSESYSQTRVSINQKRYRELVITEDGDTESSLRSDEQTSQLENTTAKRQRANISNNVTLEETGETSKAYAWFCETGPSFPPQSRRRKLQKLFFRTQHRFLPPSQGEFPKAHRLSCRQPVASSGRRPFSLWVKQMLNLVDKNWKSLPGRTLHRFKRALSPPGIESRVVLSGISVTEKISTAGWNPGSLISPSIANLAPRPAIDLSLRTGSPPSTNSGLWIATEWHLAPGVSKKWRRSHALFFCKKVQEIWERFYPVRRTLKKAEAILVIRGMRAARSVGLERVILLTDCRRLVRAFKLGSDDLSWGALTLAQDMLGLASSFTDFRFRYISRSLNFEAHALAAKGHFFPAFSIFEPLKANSLVNSATAALGVVNQLHLTNLAKASTSVTRQDCYYRRGRSQKKGVMEGDGDGDNAGMDSDFSDADSVKERQGFGTSRNPMRNICIGFKVEIPVFDGSVDAVEKLDNWLDR
ncbi:hypothetical protein GIB67_033291, partial [Kingdonia uniflora]